MSVTKQAGASPSEGGLLRRAARSPAFRKLKYRVMGSSLVRRLFTGNYRCGRVALGERNSYNFPPGWITVDWAEADFPLWISTQTRLPFADASQDVVYSAHMMEHVEIGALAHLLREVARILKPGGAARIEIPDVDRLVAAYRANNREFLDYFRSGREELLAARPELDERILEDHITVLGEVSNYIDRDVDTRHVPVYAPKDEFERELANGIASFNDWAQGLKTAAQRISGGHANALNFERISALLMQAGFRDVRRVDLGETTIARLRLSRSLRRLYDAVPETPSRRFYSLYLEATR